MISHLHMVEFINIACMYLFFVGNNAMRSMINAQIAHLRRKSPHGTPLERPRGSMSYNTQ
jgi:hypothetical protein